MSTFVGAGSQGVKVVHTQMKFCHLMSPFVTSQSTKVDEDCKKLPQQASKWFQAPSSIHFTCCINLPRWQLNSIKLYSLFFQAILQFWIAAFAKTWNLSNPLLRVKKFFSRLNSFVCFMKNFPYYLFAICLLQYYNTLRLTLL